MGASQVRVMLLVLVNIPYGYDAAMRWTFNV